LSGFAQEVSGQKPVMLIGDTFQFTPGSWATYTLHDKTDDTYYTMTMSILESVRKNGKDCAWMEIEIETDKELVVTRILTEKTRIGPGEIFEVIVYVHGMTPFTIPQKWLKDEEKKVGDFKVGQVQSRVAQRTIKFGGYPLDVFDVDAIDEHGDPFAATVSLAIAPIGILMADTKDMAMYLEDWGTGARTRVVGKPVGFIAWTFGLVGKALSGADIEMKARPQRALDVGGAWEEADGPCAGSRWTLSGASLTAATVGADSRCDGRTAPMAHATSPRWKTDKVLTFTLPGRGPHVNRVSIAFSSATRAVVMFTDPNGRSALATLRKAGTRLE
jgi:hypothetical protein